MYEVRLVHWKCLHPLYLLFPVQLFHPPTNSSCKQQELIKFGNSATFAYLFSFFANISISNIYVHFVRHIVYRCNRLLTIKHSLRMFFLTFKLHYKKSLSLMIYSQKNNVLNLVLISNIINLYNQRLGNEYVFSTESLLPTI